MERGTVSSLVHSMVGFEMNSRVVPVHLFKRRLKMRQIVLAGLWLMCGSLFAGEMQNFTADDLVRLQRVGDPQASPDGNSVAFILRRTDMEADKGRTSLWLMNTGAKNCGR